MFPGDLGGVFPRGGLLRGVFPWGLPARSSQGGVFLRECSCGVFPHGSSWGGGLSEGGLPKGGGIPARIWRGSDSGQPEDVLFPPASLLVSISDFIVKFDIMKEPP